MIPTGLDKQHCMLMLATDSSLNGVAKAAGCVLLDHYNLETGLCFPSIELIAAESNCAERSVRRALSDLKKAGWIDWIRYGGRGHTNLYSINWQHYEAAKNEYAARQQSYRRLFRHPGNPDQPVRVDDTNPDEPVRVEAPDPDIPIRQPGPTCPVNPDHLVLQTLEGTRERNRENFSSSFENEIEEGENTFDNEHIGETVSAWQKNGNDIDTELTRRDPSPADLAKRCWRCDVSMHFMRTEKAGINLDEFPTDIADTATAAELERKGAGFAVILEHLGSPDTGTKGARRDGENFDDRPHP